MLKNNLKIVRVRGKKQYVAEIERDVNGKAMAKKDANGKIIYKLNEKGEKIPRLQQGDTIRGSLHQDSIYGAIKNPLNQEEIKYVIRKDLESLKANDVDNIVDETVKQKVKEAIENKILLLSSNAQQKNKLVDDVWLNKEKQVKGKKVLYPIAKSNYRDVVLKRGQQVVFYDKEVENPKDISEVIDFKGRIYIIEGLSIQRIVRPSGKIDEYGVIMLKYFKEARKADEIKKDNYKPDGVFKLGENRPTRKMNHSQFTAFVEGIDFKVLPTGKFDKI